MSAGARLVEARSLVGGERSQRGGHRYCRLRYPSATRSRQSSTLAHRCGCRRADRPSASSRLAPLPPGVTLRLVAPPNRIATAARLAPAPPPPPPPRTAPPPP